MPRWCQTRNHTLLPRRFVANLNLALTFNFWRNYVSATNPCSVPLAPGTGTENLTRYYYNADSRQCVQYTYNGIGGNQNNFNSKGECEATCPGKKPNTSETSETIIHNKNIFHETIILYFLHDPFISFVTKIASHEFWVLLSCNFHFSVFSSF